VADEEGKASVVSYEVKEDDASNRGQYCFA